ncbi:MAG: cytochrome P460 family protein [Pseudomonadota bacterium]
MKSLTKLTVSAFVVMLGTAQGALADGHSCTFEKDPFDFDQSEIDALYACVVDDLAAGYATEGHEIGSVYRDWTPTATGPYNPGPHGERFLNTFANDVAAEQYNQYAFGEFEMPVGSVLAKESYKLRDDGTPRRGPLFIMTKVAAGGEAEEFDNWVYSAVQPNGKNMGVKQSFCHNCHQAFADQDSMGYPDPSVRLTN